MSKDVIHKVSSYYTQTFIKNLTLITDFSKVEKGTRIFSSRATNPLNFDYFLNTTTYLGEPGITYKNPLEGRDFTTTSHGWYYWDKEKACEALIESRDKEGRSLFINAIIHEMDEIIDVHLEKETLLDVTDNYEKPPFFHAANNQNYSLCKKLYAKGIKIDTLDYYKQTALHVTCFLPEKITQKEKEKSLINCFKIVSFLLDLGFDTNAEDNDLETPLINCCRQSLSNHKVAELLVHHGANVNHFNNDGLSALYYAVENDHVHIAELLLKNKATINTTIVKEIKSELMAELFNEYVQEMDEETETTFRVKALKIMLM